VGVGWAAKSHEWPRVSHAGRVFGKALGGTERAGPREKRCPLLGREQAGERPRQALRGEPPGRGADIFRDRLSREVPDDRAELWLDVEAEAVVDRVEAAVTPEEAVSALAIGVVRDQVEGAQARERVALLRTGPEREVVLLEVGIDEQLNGARAVRTLPLEGR